jgi:hypothetical protein
MKRTPPFDASAVGLISDAATPAAKLQRWHTTAPLSRGGHVIDKKATRA